MPRCGAASRSRFALDDLDLMYAALDCTVADLLQTEPVADAQAAQDSGQLAVGTEGREAGR